MPLSQTSTFDVTLGCIWWHAGIPDELKLMLWRFAGIYSLRHDAMRSFSAWRFVESSRHKMRLTQIPWRRADKWDHSLHL